MISWESILSVFNTKGTLLKWLQKLEKALKDGVLLSVTVNTVSEGVITLTFNFADGSTVTTPQIDIPQGAAGTIQVGTVTTGEEGTNVVIENTGTPQAAILNFTIPRGNTGEQGVPGPAGPDIFNDFISLKIDTTDATVTYINGVATITNARLIGYKSGGNEEVEIAVDLPIKAGDNVTIGASEDDKSILITAGGGITQSTVIERPESLPTATADSPDFVEVGGVLYRKKAVEGSSLLGTWVFNDTISSLASSWSSVEFNISFTSNNVQFIRMNHAGPDNALQYYNGSQYTFAYDFLRNTWDNTAYKTIQITDISALTNEAEFTTWLTANATKQSGGGGATVTYSYVALADA